MSLDYYNNWNKFKDVDDDHGSSNTESNKNDYSTSLNQEDPFMGHQHDHHEESQFFNLPEVEKMKICESHRHMGNFLFREGLIPKACEQYKLALSLYEYCFPEQDEEQLALDSIRFACLCNISLCYLRMDYNRKAIEAATQAIGLSHQIEAEVSQMRSKAYFRRAQAHRALDEYDAALSDLTHAQAQHPTDGGITREILSLKKQMLNTQRNDSIVAKRALGVHTDEVVEQKHRPPTENEASLVDAPSPTIDSAEVQAAVALSPSLNMALPLEPVLSHSLCRLLSDIHRDQERES